MDTPQSISIIIPLAVFLMGVISAVIGALARYSVQQAMARITSLENRMREHHEDHDAHVDSRMSRQLDRMEADIRSIQTILGTRGGQGRQEERERRD